MGKRNLKRLFTGMILAGVLGISCPEVEQLAIVTAQAETNSQEGTTPSDKTRVTTAPLQFSVTWKKTSAMLVYCEPKRGTNPWLLQHWIISQQIFRMRV